MRIIRPQQLIVLKSGYQIGRESHMGISIVAGCYLSKPEHFVTESQIWQAWKASPLSFHMLDCAEPKPFAEYLLAGHAGIGEEVRSLDVQIKVGPLSRRWRIEGESDKAGLLVKPFIRMPLDHPQSWGGEGCKENPLGRGYPDSSNPMLMSIGFDGAAITRSPLAAPTPIPHDFQLRKTHLDNVAAAMTDQHYLETYYPGLPPNIDRRYFQLAAPSQWLKTAEWPDSIPYELQGFRPDGAIVAGTFSAVRARTFVWHKNSSEPQEVPLQRKTLWLLPDHDLGLIIFTGSIPLGHLFDEPVETLLAALDHAATMREKDHYHQVYARRSTADAPTFEFLNDPDLMPAGMPLNVIRDLADHPDSLRYNPTPLTREESEQFYQNVRETIELQKQHKEPESSLEVPTPPDENSETGMQWLQSDEDSAENKTFSGIDFSGLVIKNKRLRYCTFNNCRFENSKLIDCTFEFCQFTHNQLTGSHWHNTHLSGCFIKHTQLHKATFERCKHEKVTLESVTFKNCHFTDSLWDRCIITQSDFSDSQFELCTLNGSFFSDAIVSQVQHNQSKLVSCIFEKCTGLNAIFTESSLEKSSFISGNWRGVRFSACQIDSITTGLCADFSASHFEQCSMTKVGFSKANLHAATFIHCSLLEGCCDKANLDQATITHCDMASLRLKDANLTHSLWQSTSLQQGMLYNTDLRNTAFLRCNLAGANLAMTSQNLATRFEHCLLEKAHWLPRRHKVPSPQPL